MTTDEIQQESSLADDLAANLVTDDAPDFEATDEAIEPEVTDEVTEALEALEPPPKWDKRYKEVFTEWGQHPNGRKYQEAMLELYNSGQSYTTKVEQERAEYRKQLEQAQQYAQGWNQVISPYQQWMAETGMTPDQIVRQSLGLLQALRNNPQQTMMRLAREANIDLRTALEGEPWQSPESKQVQELQRKLDRIERERQQREHMRQAEQYNSLRAQNAQQIKAFVEATDESGELIHPHVDKVQDRMAELIYGRENLRKANTSLPSLTLDEAYETACKLSPEIAQEMDRSAEAKRLAAKAAEAKKAKQAAKTVQAGGTGKEPNRQSLREAIEANLQTAA